MIIYFTRIQLTELSELSDIVQCIGLHTYPGDNWGYTATERVFHNKGG